MLKVKLRSFRIPLIISWQLLNRCNRRCLYCYQWDVVEEEMKASEVFATIDACAAMGTQVIIFSGGEPLLRNDIGPIVRHCRTRGIFTGITSNGDLVEQKIHDIRVIDMLKLSFDGPQEIHDLIRGDGSYKEVMNAIKVAKKNKINVKLNVTLTKYNVDQIPFILKKARELNVAAKFQPVNYTNALGRDINFLLPEEKKYKQAIQMLIDLKKNNSFIINSTAGLRYIYDWPQPSALKCYAGKLICCISSNGNVYPCSAMRHFVKPVNCLDARFQEAFYRMPLIPSCKGCWCTSTLELNCLLCFKMDTILNIRKLFSNHN